MPHGTIFAVGLVIFLLLGSPLIAALVILFIPTRWWRDD